MDYIFYPSIIFGLFITIFILIGFYYYVKNNSNIELFTPLYIVISSLSMMTGIILARILWQSSVSLAISVSYIAGIAVVTFLMLSGYLVKTNIKFKARSSHKTVDSMDNLINKGFLAAEDGNYNSAVEIFNTVLSDAQDGKIKIMIKKELAFVYKLTGNNEKAKNEIKEALEIAKNTGDNSLLELEKTLQIM